MLPSLKKRWPFGSTDDADAPATSSPAMRPLVANLHYELVPMASIDEAIDDLPLGRARVGHLLAGQGHRRHAQSTPSA